MDFPITVRVRGVEIQVGSLADLDALVERYGSAADRAPYPPLEAADLHEEDRQLLERFLEAPAHKVLVKDVRAVLSIPEGAKTTSALKAWSTRTGLNFLIKSKRQGRAYQLSDQSLGLARHLISLSRQQRAGSGATNA